MKKKIVRSPFFYVGDKYKLIEEISSYFPDDIEKFVEPFVGGGSVFMNIDARKFYLNDIDVNVIVETDPEQGNANLTVVNKVGSKLPVTGTPAMAILLVTGAGLMAVAVTKARKKE